MLRWYYKLKMGSFTIIQGDRKHKVDIYGGNAMAIFTHTYRNEKGELMEQLMMFIDDKRHLKNMMESKTIGDNRQFGYFAGKVTNVRLNMWYKENYEVLKFFFWLGCKVSCYYKDKTPKTKSKTKKK